MSDEYIIEGTCVACGEERLISSEKFCEPCTYEDAQDALHYGDGRMYGDCVTAEILGVE